MPMYSFFDKYDFKGKTIIPFSSHGGSGWSGSLNVISQLEPEATMVTYAKATGTTDKEIFLIPGATYIKTYYVPDYVDKAVKKQVEFFGKRLKNK